MKTETEFQDKLKKHLRRVRKKLCPHIIARKMNMTRGVYFACEVGDLKMNLYQLYQFMNATGQDAEYVKQLFDDNWIPPCRRRNQAE